jgi:hypothetical protein
MACHRDLSEWAVGGCDQSGVPGFSIKYTPCRIWSEAPANSGDSTVSIDHLRLAREYAAETAKVAWGVSLFLPSLWDVGKLLPDEERRVLAEMLLNVLGQIPPIEKTCFAGTLTFIEGAAPEFDATKVGLSPDLNFAHRVGEVVCSILRRAIAESHEVGCLITGAPSLSRDSLSPLIHAIGVEHRHAVRYLMDNPSSAGLFRPATATGAGSGDNISVPKNFSGWLPAGDQDLRFCLEASVHRSRYGAKGITAFIRKRAEENVKNGVASDCNIEEKRLKKVEQRFRSNQTGDNAGDDGDSGDGP